MHFNNVAIAGLAFVDAPHRILSAELEERIAPVLNRFDLRPNLIQELSGIIARRHWDTDFQPSDAATEAARLAIEDAGIDPNELGILVNTSVTRDYVEPSVACLVHGNLQLPPSCMNFDIGNACLGFMNGMQVIGNMIDRGQIKYGIVVNGETTRWGIERTIERLLDPNCDPETFRNNFASLTLGSGAAAMVLTHADLAPEAPRVIGGVTMAATQHNMLCVAQVDEMLTDAHGLLVAGLELAVKTYGMFLEAVDSSPEEIARVFIHQVSAPHTQKVAIEALKIASEKIYKIYPEFGNIGPAGIAIALAKASKEGIIKKGERVALMGIGSGLNCSMMAVDW